jgi:hypothetical protein
MITDTSLAPVLQCLWPSACLSEHAASLPPPIHLCLLHRFCSLTDSRRSRALDVADGTPCCYLSVYLPGLGLTPAAKVAARFWQSLACSIPPNNSLHLLGLSLEMVIALRCLQNHPFLLPYGLLTLTQVASDWQLVCSWRPGFACANRQLLTRLRSHRQSAYATRQPIFWKTTKQGRTIGRDCWTPAHGFKCLYPRIEREDPCELQRLLRKAIHNLRPSHRRTNDPGVSRGEQRVPSSFRSLDLT